ALALAACAAPVSTPPAPAPASASAAPAPASASAGATVRAAAETITPEDLRARVEFIASDQMRGRDTPSPELEIVAGYLVNQYKLWGFQPAGEEGTFYQWYPFPLRRLSAGGARLQLAAGGRTQSFALGRDFYAHGGTRAPLSGGLVFVGSAPTGSLGEGTLRGRVAVAALPGRFNRAFRTERSRQRTAAMLAGASGIIHVLDASWTADTIAKYAASAGTPARTLGGEPGFPQFYLTRDAGARLFSAAGLDMEALWARMGQAGFQPVALSGVDLSAGLPLEELDRAVAPNVVAMIPGSDPVLRNEYVVISAHMDHVGVGAPDATGDSIYNGADDDASGTSGLLEVAQAFAALGQRPKRTVVFLHVSGEEKGLLGSEWYADHPTLPLERIVANINVDMIGRNANDSIVVIGKDYTSLGALTDRLAAEHPELGLTLADDVWPEERFFFRSDHFNFARKEVPAIFFFNGTHEDYHRPSDEVEKLNADKAARVSRMVFYLAHAVADDPRRPTWVPAGLSEVRAMSR
ncbi:MAG TPA: M20/M25/M40 family metallo-hydrolase, partial [Longimicrobium sp.]|nr:M20/M25/M40 family metallo-hydrolase [Longimicrobium sp.]